MSHVEQSWLDWNFYDTEQDLVDRLKVAFQTGPDAWARIVGTRDDLAEVTESQQTVPGVYVVYRTYQVVSATDKRAALRHLWFVVLAVSVGATKQRESVARNKLAGRYLPAILRALHGYTPAGATTPLVPVTPPPPKPSADGRFGYYPVAFTCDAHYSTAGGPAVGPLPLDRR
jgi:hypothetical protein